MLSSQKGEKLVGRFLDESFILHQFQFLDNGVATLNYFLTLDHKSVYTTKLQFLDKSDNPLTKYHLQEPEQNLP